MDNIIRRRVEVTTRLNGISGVVICVLIMALSTIVPTRAFNGNARHLSRFANPSFNGCAIWRKATKRGAPNGRNCCVSYCHSNNEEGTNCSNGNHANGTIRHRHDSGPRRRRRGSFRYYVRLFGNWASMPCSTLCEHTCSTKLPSLDTKVSSTKASRDLTWIFQPSNSSMHQLVASINFY